MAITKMKGIDVSKWQGDIDFNKVKNDGIEFVILRSSFRHTTDQKFLEYAKGFKEAGIPIAGVYHFSYALSVAQATSEARYCIEQVESAGLSKDEVIIFFDFEYDTIKKAKEAGVELTKADCNAHALAFCEYVEKQGYEAGIYTNLDFYKNWFDKKLFDQYYLWLADYSGDPDYDCVFHQYSSTGKVDGITGNVDLDYFYGLNDETHQDGGDSMEVRFPRSAMVAQAQKWVGKKESNGSFKEIIDVYNSYLPHPRGVKMDYKTAWCACFWSALAIKCGYTEIVPIEISCGQLINLAKSMGIWVENDAFVPQPGDAILYDWDDSGKGDNTGWPDHIGIIETVNKSSGYMVVIEGNYSDSVKRRTVSINGKYIRGFITPKYDCDWVEPPTVDESGKTIDEVAHEVISGKWGNGDERKNRLSAAGYDYAEVQAKVNAILNGSAVTPTTPEQPQTQPTQKKVTASCSAKSFNKNLAGTYVTTGDLYLRNDAGTNKKALCVIPKNTEVKNYGYYTLFNKTKWLYIQVAIDGVMYTGFSSSVYLKKK